MGKYSAEELELVKRLFDGKRGARDIAKELGITRYLEESARRVRHKTA